MSTDNQGQDTTGADGDSTTLVTAAVPPPAGGDSGAPDTGTTDKGTEGDKGTGAPETYADFQLPEVYKLDDATLGAFKDFAKSKGLTQEEAQGALGIFAKHFESAVQANVEAFKAASAEWANQTKADKEFGGAKFEASKVLVGTAMEQFADADFIQLLNQSQLGNHPAVFRFLAKVGQAIGERPLNNGGGGDGPAGVPKSTADKLYPDLAAKAA